MMKGYVLLSFDLLSAQTANLFGRIARYTSSLADALTSKRALKSAKANL